MPFEVRYSSRAYAEYEALFDYVIENFSSSVAVKVDMHFEEVIDQIAINPFLSPSSNKVKNLRRCVISQQTILYYRFNGKYIEIVSFRGSMMNPQSLGL